MDSLNVMSEEVESLVNLKINYENGSDSINDELQKKIDDDIEKTQRVIADGCEMLSVKESYNKLKEKYDF